MGSGSLSYGVWSQAFFDVVSIVLKFAPTRDDSFSGLESLTLISLSCSPKLSPAGKQTVKHDELYPLGHSKLIFSFWSYPSFLHDAGGQVIKTIGLRNLRH